MALAALTGIPERTASRQGPAVRLEGGLFGPDILERLESGDLPGQRPADFGFPAGRSLVDEIAAAYRDAQDFWRVFRRRLDRTPEDDPATSLTRDGWVIPFLDLLGYDLYYNRRAYEVGGVRYAVSHRAGENDDAPPVHVVGARRELGRVDPTAYPRLSPHALLQEFLNRSDHLWGVVTNGRVLRLLRKSALLRRQAYVEFDLEAIFEGDRFRDFALLYRLLHRTRLPAGVADGPDCLLERYHQEALDQGNRARDRLRDGVEECIRRLANGFLRRGASGVLSSSAAPGDGETDPAGGLYQRLLRLVYRFLFLLVAEDRGLLGGSDLYREHYSIGRLRRLVDRREAYTDHEDLWLSLRVLWEVLRDGSPVPQLGGRPPAALLGLPVLDGGLFEPMDLEAWSISNRDLLEAFYHLVYYYDEGARTYRRVNYAALDVEELGSVYESLLDHHPVLVRRNGRLEFDFAAGTERKSTGSYYTPPELVGELIKSALEPVLADRLREAERLADAPWEALPERLRRRLSDRGLGPAGWAGLPAAQRRTALAEAAVLSIRVVDPACGSGHFLLAAARRLGRELARVRTGEDEPAPEALREAVRDVVAHCIYGVDKNPLAVELCKVALWTESQTPGKPLTFLDHRIRCGDSLLGVLDLKVLAEGMPDEAFDRDDPAQKELGRQLKAINRRERAGQLAYGTDFQVDVEALARTIRELDQIADDSAADVHRKARQYAEARADGTAWGRSLLACDFWTAAFFLELKPGLGERPTTGTLRRLLADPRTVHAGLVGEVRALSGRLRFFHWPLEFPEVFADGGFDVVLCNPPWERIKLQEQEFFATRDPEIANAPNKAARERLIKELPGRNPGLWAEYRRALNDAAAASRFLRASGRFPLTARGDINTYAVFSELFTRLVNPKGRVGAVVPTGIATDDTNKQFFAHLVESGRLASLHDFENRQGLFPAVDSRYKFCLLTLRGPAPDSAAAEFAFFLTRAEQLRDGGRRFVLTAADLALLNPNTRTCPVFRTRQDAELTKAIYRRVPVLVNEGLGAAGNPWGVRFAAMFHMSNDSHLFRTRRELEGAGFRLVGNRWVRGREVWLPLYEAKMVWQFDHRYGTYAGVDSRSSTELPTPTAADHADPAFVVQPWYWVPAAEVEARLAGWKRHWLIGFRDVTNATNERTAIFSVVPRVGVGNKIPILLPEVGDSVLISAFLANACSIAFDFAARQKIGGTTMNFFYVKQFPFLRPSAYTPEDLAFIVPRVLELVYTSWDIKPFADDVWREAIPSPADEAESPLRAAIRRQWEENAAATGGRPWEPPDWVSACPEVETDPRRGIPLPPFRWDEDRRAAIRAELDAYYARLYGLTRKQLRYILDPADLTGRELEDILDPWEEVDDPLDPAGYARRAGQSRFPGETFRVLKEKELRRYGEYRTRRLILEAWERLS